MIHSWYQIVIDRCPYRNHPVAFGGEGEDLFEEDVCLAAGGREADEGAAHAPRARVVDGPHLVIVVINDDLTKQETTSE